MLPSVPNMLGRANHRLQASSAVLDLFPLASFNRQSSGKFLGERSIVLRASAASAQSFWHPYFSGFGFLFPAMIPLLFISLSKPSSVLSSGWTLALKRCPRQKPETVHGLRLTCQIAPRHSTTPTPIAIPIV